MNGRLDLTRLPLEVELILQLLKEDEIDVDTFKKLCSAIDWNLFVDYAIHHRVYPVLYCRMKSLKGECQEMIPSFVMEKLGERYRMNTYNMLRLSTEMSEIGKLFANQGIRALFLKGPIIAHELYGDISNRTLKDLDVLISLDQLERAMVLLEHLGYEREAREHIFNEWKWKFNDVSFVHPEKGVQVELHYRLNNWPEIVPSFDELWARKRKSTLTKDPCYFLGKEDLFYYLVSHGAKHGWFRLRWLLDVKQMLIRTLDWEVLYSKFARFQNVHIGGQGLVLVEELLGVQFRKEMEVFIFNRSIKLANDAMYFLERMETLQHDSTSIGTDKYFKSYYASLKPFHQRMLLYLSRMHPCSDDVATLRLPKNLYFLYFPLRPFLWMYRKGKRFDVAQEQVK